MTIEYKMRPVRRIISKLVKFEDGIPHETISLAFQLGIISEREYGVIKMIKKGQDLNLNENLIQNAIERLLEKDIIIKCN